MRVTLYRGAIGTIARLQCLSLLACKLHPGEFRRQYAGGHRDNGITDQHAHCGNRTADTCLRHNITVTYGCDGNDGPVNTLGNTVKAMFRALCDIKQAAKNSGKNDHQGEKHKDLAGGAAQRIRQIIGFLKQGQQAQHPKNPQNTQQANDEQRSGLRQYQGEIGGQQRQ